MKKMTKKGGKGVILARKAFAKINLSLDVIAKRVDGYHDLQTVMQSISLCDHLTFSPQKEGFSLDTGGVLPIEGNLVCRAADAFFAALGTSFGVHVTLQKQIPMKAGLGGGSADAAATLLALNEMAGTPFTKEQLAAIGAKIGADVPFCVFGGAALCKGTGERVTPLDSKISTPVVVVMPKEGVSTPLAFATLDEKYPAFPKGAEERTARVVSAIESGDRALLANALYNRFEEVIFPCRPDVSAAREALLASGAFAARMSGSGPALYGLFESDATATAAAKKLETLGYRTFACRME